MTRICAIHQPNFFPRLSTLVKILDADVWVVLDDVQFARRDYQHRTRIAELRDPSTWTWLSLSTHLPSGRATLIKDALLTDSSLAARRVNGVLKQYYGRSAHWIDLRDSVDEVVERLPRAVYLQEVTTASTQALLDLCGWKGEAVFSSALGARAGRSERLAHLTRAAGADTYLCGTGGARYLDSAPFVSSGLRVEYTRQPSWLPSEVWHSGGGLSALWTLARFGSDYLSSRRVQSVHSDETEHDGI